VVGFHRERVEGELAGGGNNGRLRRRVSREEHGHHLLLVATVQGGARRLRLKGTRPGGKGAQRHSTRGRALEAGGRQGVRHQRGTWREAAPSVRGVLEQGVAAPSCARLVGPGDLGVRALGPPSCVVCGRCRRVLRCHRRTVGVEGAGL
jgi:hypothetical protein